MSAVAAITSLARDADSILRPRALSAAGPMLAVPARRLAIIMTVTAGAYGVAMGAYRLQFDAGWLQPVYAAIKTPLLLVATTLLCLPAFFVINTVLGLSGRFRAAVRAIVAGQAALAVVLASLAPMLLVFYLSQPAPGGSVAYRGAQVANILAFSVAALVAQVVTRRAYRPLIAEDPRHRITLLLWFALYAFVGIQMGWILRPFIGHSGSPVTFLREEPFTNAYVVVLRILLG